MGLPLLGIAARAVATKVLPKVAKAASRVLGAARKNPVGTAITVAGGATTAVGTVQAMRPTMPPPMPVTYATPTGGPRQPRGPVRRTIERILPGGRTGRELMPYEGTEYDKIGRPIAVHPEQIERTYVPPGYVVVTMPDGQRIGVLRNVARSMGLWRPRPKPPITAGDARAIRRANSAKKRVKKLAGAVGFACHTRGRGFHKSGKRK